MLALDKVAVSAGLQPIGTSNWEPLGVDIALNDRIDDLPAGMVQRERVLSIRPHEVEFGDFLVGLPLSQVDGVLYDGACGRWLYSDSRGTLFATRNAWELVQVVRGAPIVLHRVRHLRAVR